MGGDRSLAAASIPRGCAKACAHQWREWRIWPGLRTWRATVLTMQAHDWELKARAADGTDQAELTAERVRSQLLRREAADRTSRPMSTASGDGALAAGAHKAARRAPVFPHEVSLVFAQHFDGVRARLRRFALAQRSQSGDLDDDSSRGWRMIRIARSRGANATAS